MISELSLAWWQKAETRVWHCVKKSVFAFAPNFPLLSFLVAGIVRKQERGFPIQNLAPTHGFIHLLSCLFSCKTVNIVPFHIGGWLISPLIILVVFLLPCPFLH